MVKRVRKAKLWKRRRLKEEEKVGLRHWCDETERGRGRKKWFTRR